MSAAALLRQLNDASVRADVHRAVRARYPGVSALCAITASELLQRAGLLDRHYPWTADLAAALRKRGWVQVGWAPSPVNGGNTEDGGTGAGGAGVSPAILRPGDLCFTADANANGAPDHVYFFLRWLDRARGVAEVLDNYAAHPAPRNVGAALTWTSAAGRKLRLARTPLAYALRCPVAQDPPERATPVAQSSAEAERIRAAFAVLYEHWLQLSPAARRRLNALRHDAPFAEAD